MKTAPRGPRDNKATFMKFVIAALTIAAGVVHAQSKGDALLLLCKASVQGQFLTEILTVDLGGQTVNKQRAEIDQNTMNWTSKRLDAIQGREITYKHRLDRLSGAYTSYGVGVMYAGPGPTFICEKAPPAKF